MRNTNKAFTLVELIVVITILAILGTIAFISLQGYTGDAKNSKVTSDLRNIASAIETASTRNSVVLRDVMTNQMSSYNVDTTDTFGPESLQLGDTASDVTYEVGNVDFASIGQNGEDFKDPNGLVPGTNDQSDYLFGIVTSPDFKAYQLAGQIIENDIKKSRVNGTFYTASGTTAIGLISASGATTPLENGKSLGGIDLYSGL